MAYTITLNIAGTDYDVSNHVLTDSIQLVNSLFKDMEPNTDRFSFSLAKSSNLIDDLFVNTQNVMVTVLKDGNAFFKGYLTDNYQVSIKSSGLSEIKLVAEDFGIKLLKMNWDSTNDLYTIWQDVTVCKPADTANSFVHKLATMTGVTVSSSVPLINKVITVNVQDKDGVTYWEVLKNVLFEFGYVFYFGADGKLNLYNIVVSSAASTATITPSTNMVGRLDIQKNLERYDQVDVKWKEWETLNDTLVFDDTTGRTSAYDCTIPVASGTYYPSGNTTDDIQFCEYKLESGKEIINVNTATFDIVKDSQLTLSTENLGTRAKIRFYNPSGATLYIRRIKVMGNSITVKKSDNTTTSNKGGKRIMKYEAGYVHSSTDATTLANFIQQYYSYADYSYKFSSTSSLSVGQIVTINDATFSGINVKVVIINKTEKANPSNYAYEAIGISDFNISAVVVKDSVATPPNPLEDKPSYTTLQDGTIIIDAGDIAGTVATGDLKSSNYSSGTAGFILSYNGTFQFNKDASNRIYYDGSTLKVLGNIEATTGTIGGATIASTYVQSTNYVLNTSGWKLDNANGTIYAFAGSIGGLNIGASKLYVGTGTYGNSNTSFYADSSGQFSLKDKLTWNGTTLAVSGTITATAGTIGGVSIDSSKIYVGTGTFNNANTGFYFDSSGYFSLKDKLSWNPSTDTLSVSGIVNSTSGAIGGWLIDASLLKSASSGARVELNKGYNRVSVFDSSNEKVVMGYLDGLPKNDGTGNWTSSDYGLWVRSGNTLVIDGSTNVKNGDLIASDASIKILSGSTELLKVGTTSGVVGFHSTATGLLFGTATQDVLSGHYSTKPYSDSTTAECYVHYYQNGITASLNSFANLRVKSGATYRVLRFGGNGYFNWNDNLVISNGYTSLNGSTTITATGGEVALHLYNTTDNTPIIDFHGATYNSMIQGGDAMYLFTANSPRISILANGNVGIGTTSPTGLLTLRKDGGTCDNPGVVKNNVLQFKVYYTGYDIETVKAAIGSGVDGITSWNTQNGLLTFSTAYQGTLYERMTIMANGNVGIGTTSPSVPLHVFSSTYHSTIVVQTSSSAHVGQMYVKSDGDGILQMIQYGSGISGTLIGNSITNASYLITNSVNSSQPSKLVIGTLSATPIIFGTSNAERMRIDSSGNVGIGEASTGAKLHLTGNLYLTTVSCSWSEGIRVDSAVDTWSGIRFTRGLAGYGGTPSYAYAIGFSPNSVIPEGTLGFYSYNGGSSFMAMVLTPAGNIGIGTTSPSFPLEITKAVTNTWQTRFFNGTDIYLSHSDGYGMHINTHNTSSLRYALELTNNSTNLMYVRNDGNVGIGTPSPETRLHLPQSSYLKIGDTSYAGGIYSYHQPNYGNHLQIGMYHGSSTFNPHIHLKYDGNVGIGTTSPVYKLDVVGSVYATNVIASSNMTSYSDSTNNVSYWATMRSGGTWLWTLGIVDTTGYARGFLGYSGGTVNLSSKSSSGGKEWNELQINQGNIFSEGKSWVGSTSGAYTNTVQLNEAGVWLVSMKDIDDTSGDAHAFVATYTSDGTNCYIMTNLGSNGTWNASQNGAYVYVNHPHTGHQVRVNAIRLAGVVSSS